MGRTQLRKKYERMATYGVGVVVVVNVGVVVVVA